MSAPIWTRFTENYFRYPVDYSLMDQFNLTANVVRQVEALCREDAYNIVAYKHLGDVFYFLGAKEALEKTFGGKVHYILLPQHEFLAKLWNITDYSTFPLDKLVKKNKAFVRAFFDKQDPDPFILDSDLENLYLLQTFGNIPQRTKPFVLENLVNKFSDYPYYWCFRWAQSAGVEEEFRFRLPRGEVPLSSRTKEVVEKLGGLDRIILLAPEAATATELPPEWWAVLAQSLRSKGYQLLVNSKRIRIPGCQSAFDLGLSLEEVVAVGLRCRAVFSLRSGLADVLVPAGERLFVFNPAMLRREKGSLNYPFEEPTGVHELQIHQWNISDCRFEDIEIGELLRPYVKACRWKFYKELFLSLFHRKVHRFWYNVFRDIAGWPKRFPENNIMNPPSTEKQFSLGPLSFYKKRLYRRNNDFVLERSFLNGFIKTQRREAGKKLKLLGIPIISLKDRESRTIRFLGVPVYRKNRREEFYQYLSKHIRIASEETYGKGSVADHVFIIRHNLGETTLYLAEFEQWAEQVGAKRPLLVVWRRRDLSFVKLFLNGRPFVKFVPIAQSDINCFLKEDLREIDGITIHVPTPEIAEAMKEAALTQPDVNFADWIRQSMSLKDWDDPRRPEPTAIARKRASWVLSHAGVQRPFVLLCPEAISLKTVSDTFWCDLAEHFSEEGYDVLVNRYAPQGKSSLLESFSSCSPDVEVLFALAQKAERIVSMASGLGVLLSLTGRPVDLLYSDTRNRHIGYSAEFCRRMYSVHHMPWSEVKLVREHVVEDLSKVLNAILSRNIAQTSQ